MKPLFPATYSTLCPNALCGLVATKYNLTNVKCTFLVRGVGDTYLVQSAADRYILRVYRSSHRSLLQIKEEVELLHALQRENVSASYPLRDSSGESILAIEAIEGIRHAVLFTYAEGNSVRLLNENQLLNLGREMARFHNVSSGLRLAGHRWTFDLKTTLFKPLEQLKAKFEGDTEAYDWLCARAREVEEKLPAFSTAGFSTGYCHFDFLPKNFHFENDSVTFFDFDFMGYGWLVNDIMSFWQHLELEVYAARMTKQASADAYQLFLKGYHEYRNVSDAELAVVPYLSLGFWLFYMGFHTTHDQFYIFSQPAHLKAYVGVIRHVVDGWSK